MTIVGLAILLSSSFFLDLSIAQTISVRSCDDVDESYECFNRTTFDYVDCEDEEDQMFSRNLHCFRFIRLGIDVRVLSSLAEAFAFYLATVAFFGKIFSTVKVFLHFRPSRFWGIGFIVLGCLLFIGAVVLLAVSDEVEIRINVIELFQFIMICIFMVIVGLLLIEGEWYERIPGKYPIGEIPLVHFDDTTEHKFTEFEHKFRDTHELGRDGATGTGQPVHANV